MHFTKSCLNLFVLISIVKPSISQINKDCVSWGLRGVCVSSESCGFFNKATKAILNVETLKTVQDRVAACEKYQKDSICCEKGDVKSNVLVTTTPSQKTSLAKVTFKTLTTQRLPTTTTLKLSKIIESTTRTTLTTTAKATPTSTTTAPGTSTSPPTLAAEDHPKYKLFKDLKCGLIHSDRVAGGENADFYEFPWAARLGYENKLGEIKYKCGGSLISEFYVLTAAHCLVGLKSRLKLNQVRLGEYDISKEIDCDPEDPERCADPVQDIKIQSVVSHPEYNSKKYTDDIGLVELSEAAKTMQKNIEPICLPITEELQEPQKLLVVIGWGRTDSSTYSEILQKAVVPLFNYTICHQQVMKKFKITLNGRQFCAGGEGKIDVCKGDSGSPIMGSGLLKGKPKLIQYGIVSYGSPCGVEEGFPGIYTEVSKFLPWILDNVR